MPKEGYYSLTVKEQDAKKLQRLAEASGKGIVEYFSDLVKDTDRLATIEIAQTLDAELFRTLLGEAARSGLMAVSYSLMLKKITNAETNESLVKLYVFLWNEYSSLSHLTSTQKNERRKRIQDSIQNELESVRKYKLEDKRILAVVNENYTSYNTKMSKSINRIIELFSDKIELKRFIQELRTRFVEVDRSQS